jgi:hypothetical protein
VRNFRNGALKKKICFFVGAILALALSFSEMKKILSHFNPALIFCYFSPAPALCGDQEKSTNIKSNIKNLIILRKILIDTLRQERFTTFMDKG